MSPTRILSLENTHNGGGGRVWPLEQLRAVVGEARELGLSVHLDGARLLNAAVASGVSAATYGREFDTVTLCLSKGLGCPLGALLATSSERIDKARRFKHLFGGAMRQAGIVAAAGLYALEHHVDRLAEDHENARRLGEGMAEAGLPVDLAQVETNFVLVDVGALGLQAGEALGRLEAEGVLLSTGSRRGRPPGSHALDVGPGRSSVRDRRAIARALERDDAPTPSTSLDRSVELAVALLEVAADRLGLVRSCSRRCSRSKP